MKKLLLGIFSLSLLFASVSAVYTPTSKDTALVNVLSPIFQEVAQKDTLKANSYLTKLHTLAHLFVNKNPRFAYIFGAIANAIEDELAINNDGDYQINTPDTLVYITALDGSSIAANLDVEKFGCDDKLYPVSITGALTPEQALRAMFDYRVETPAYTDYTETYNVFDNSTLTIDSFEVHNHTAVIKLQGNLYVGGMCETPRVFAQIRKTLTQFPTIDDVEVYINDESLESFLSEKDDEDVGTRAMDMSPLTIKGDGAEPFWAIKTNNNILTFTDPMDEEHITRNFEVTSIESEGEISISDGNDAIRVILQDEECVGDMNGFTYAYKATVHIDGRELHGCANIEDIN